MNHRDTVVARSPDRATLLTAGLPGVLASMEETFGQQSGTVRRPCHNKVLSHSSLFVVAVSLCLCGSLFFYRLGDRELTSSHEARAAQNAQQMINTGDWSLPHLFDRRAELQKPPLYYWLVAALAQLSGGHVDAWMVRLPAALAALATVLLVALIGRWCGRPRMGLIAAIILATSLHFTWMARVGRIDMPLTLTVTATLAGYYLGQRQRARRERGAWRCF